MVLSSNEYALQGQRLEKTLGQKSGSQSARMARLWQFLQGHPKHAFSEKVQKGDQGKFFKNRLEGCWKGQKALWRKGHYPLISMHLKSKEWPSYNNFRKVTQNPNFLKMCKGGTKGNFSKNRPKSSPRLKGLKAHWRKWHYPLICTHLKCKDWRIFWRKHRLQTVFEWASYGNYRKITQNPHFLKKERRGDQGKFFKNRPKSSPCLKGRKALAQVELYSN